MIQDKMIIQDVRYAVVVLGMHRSGTSALAGVLARLGCDTPKDLMEAKPMNAKGFYESNKISYMNDGLLQSAGSSWFTWQEFNKGWFKSPKAAEFRDLALTNLKEVFDTSRLALLKDPRMCLLVPFWDDVLSAAGYVPKYLHTHRNALEVTLSLSHWAGYDPAYGQLLWLRYVLEAEAATRGKARCFTSYHQLMQDWSTVAHRTSDALDLAWPSFSDRVCAEIDEFLEGDLQHMKAQSNRLGRSGRLSPWVAETFDIMERWAEKGEDPNDHTTLDAFRENFNRATPVFSTLVETGRRDALSLQVKVREEERSLAGLATLQGEATQLREHLKAAQGESAELRRLAEEARAQVQTLNAAQEQARAERAEVAARLEAAQGELEKAHTLLAEFEDETKELKHRKATLESELNQRSHEAEQVGGQLADARRDIERLAGELDKTAVKRDALVAEQEQMRRKLRVETIQLEKQLREDLATALQRHREREDSALVQIRATQTALELASEKAQALTTDKAALQLSLKKSAAEAKQLESQLVNVGEQVESLTKELQTSRIEREKLMAERNAFLRDLRNEKIRSEQEMRNQLVSALRDNRENADAARTKAEADIAALRWENAAQEEQALAERAEVAARLEAAQGESAELRRLAEEAQAQVQTLQEQAIKHQRDAEANVQDLLNSTSWRMTAPLRRFVLAYRGIRGRT